MKNTLISEKAVKLLTYRIQQEELSSRLYEQMALFLDDKGYKNSAKVWFKWASEELNHAKWAKDYLLAFGLTPMLQDLDAPKINFTSLCDVIRKSFEHEINITEQCNELASESLKLNDHVLYSLAVKYTHEQIEELDKLQTLMDILETFGESKEAMLLLDSHIDEYI